MNTILHLNLILHIILLPLFMVKTKYLPIALRSGSEPPNTLKITLHSCGRADSLTCGCHSIERVEYYKYLGVVLDAKLRYENHINYLKMKLRKMIFPFRQISDILNFKEIKTVYCAFVQSVLQYGIIAYGGAHKTIIEPLSVVQKVVIKVGFKKNKLYPSELLFRETSILPVRKLYVRTLIIYVFSKKDSVISPIPHSYLTRHAQNVGTYMPCIVKIVNHTNSFFIANFLYRNIPTEIRDINTSEQTSGHCLAT